MGTRPIIYKYPLDKTGRSPDNLIVGEPHTLPAGMNRPIVTNYGAFFTDRLVVRDASSGQTLTPHRQYKAVQLYQDATVLTGKEVCSVIVVVDTTVSDTIEIDYQVVGGEYSTSVRAVREMVDDLDLDHRPVAWGDIIGKPRQFAPAPHLHDAGDVYGFEYLVEAIERIRQAILVGNEPVLIELREYIQELDREMRDRLMPAATLDEVLQGERDDVVLTPKVFMQAFDALYLSEAALTTHMQQRNAHNVQLEELGMSWGSDQPRQLATVTDVLPILAGMSYS